MSIDDTEIKDLAVGDIIYECGYGTNIEVRIVSKPEETGEGYEGRKQWRWDAENTQTGEPIHYLLTEGLSHYGPRLYRQPRYVRVAPGGAWSFPRLGGTDIVPAEVSAHG